MARDTKENRLALYRVMAQTPEDEYYGGSQETCLIGHPARMGELAEEYERWCDTSRQGSVRTFMAERFGVDLVAVNDIFSFTSRDPYQHDLIAALEMARVKLGLTEQDIKDTLEVSNEH